MSPSPVLSPVVVEGLVRSFASRAGASAATGRGASVLDGLDLVVAPGSRLGLIGENGAGKSTLLRLLAGEDTPDAGTLAVPSDVVHLSQEPAATAGTVGDLLADALRPLRDAVAEVELLACELADGNAPGTEEAYDAALAWALAHDAWDAERRTDVVASALGVAELEARRPVSTLSGGQRTRLALAAALVRRPACLLLDEPTNHLDDEALELLERELPQMPGVVVAASHDRTFLDGVCTELLDLDAGELGTDGQGGKRFGGTFTEYLAHQERSRARWEQAWASQQAEIERLRAETARGLDAVAPGRGPRDNDKFITKFKGARVERTRARRVRDAERRLAVAEREALGRPPAPLRFSGRLTGAGAATVSVRGLAVDGRVHVERLDVAAGEKVLVTGANGSGKSTLLAVLHGDLAPDAGTVEVSAQRIGLVAQDPDVGPPGRSATAFYAGAVGDAVADEVPLRTLGLLPPREEHTSVESLSVGQRRRLSLAAAVASGPDLLLLDEPTNHLSLRLAAELEEALAVAPGTVVVTSHDRWLRRRWDGPEVALS